MHNYIWCPYYLPSFMKFCSVVSEELRWQTVWRTDGRPDRQTDRTKTICLPMGGDIMKLLKKIENRQQWQKKLYIISKITSRYLKRWHILWLPPLICTFQNMYICMDMLIYIFFMILLHGQEIKMSTLCTSTGKYSCSVGQGLMDTNADHLSS